MSRPPEISVNGLPGVTRVALFDLDGTLLDGQSYRYLFRTLWDQRWRRVRLVSLPGTMFPAEAFRRVWPGARLRVQDLWAARVARLFRGARIEAVQALCQTATRRLMRALRQSALDEMEHRRATGCKVVLASTAILPLVAEVGTVLGADGSVGTPLEVRDGHYTGRLAGPVCNGADKVAYVQALTASWRVPIEWRASWAYTDAILDLPMLRMVGHPVAVAPERRLHALAGRSGWTVVR